MGTGSLSFETVSQSRCFGGTQFVYRHDSRETGTPMRLAVFVPPQAETGKVPVVWFLSGLTCTEENFTVKAGAQRVAAALGLLLVAPDTSPRGEDVPTVLVVDGQVNEGAVWYYPEPKEAAAEIKGRVAFWQGVVVTD